MGEVLEIGVGIGLTLRGESSCVVHGDSLMR